MFSDVASGINFDKRKGFFAMLDKIMAGKCERVVIAYKDRVRTVQTSVWAVQVRNSGNVRSRFKKVGFRGDIRRDRIFASLLFNEVIFKTQNNKDKRGDCR